MLQHGRLYKAHLILPILYLFIVLGVNYYLGFISFNFQVTSLAARDAATALIAPLLVAFAWWASYKTLYSSAFYLSFLLSHRRKKSRARLAETLRFTFFSQLLKALPYIFVCALLVSSGYVFSQGIADKITEQPKRVVLLLQAIPMWLTGLSLFSSNIIVLRFIKRHLQKHFRVRLFEMEEMMPLCKLVLHNVCLLSILLAIYSITFLFVEVPLTDAVLLSVISLLIVLLLFQPILEVHSVVAKRRSLALARINDSLKTEISPEKRVSETRRLVDDDTRLQFISDLLTVRTEIERAPSWPLTLPFTLKILVLILLPMLSWTGAGLMSQLIKVIL